MKRISIFLIAVLILIGAVAANALTITPVDVVASSATSNQPAVNLINNSGLDAAGLLHDNEFKNMWLNSKELTKGTLTFDLGGLYSITSTDIWQYNYDVGSGGPNVGTLGRGVNLFDIWSSSDPDGKIFSQVISDVLEISTGELIAAQNVSFGKTVLASHVRFEIQSNHGAAFNTGLSEVKFNAVNPIPEPATLLLLGVGLVGLAGFGRKKLIK